MLPFAIIQNWAMRRPSGSQLQGFTLIELMVTIAIVALLAALAAPSVKEMLVRNSLSSIGNEFTGSFQRARNEATTKNMCVTMCLSANADADQPVCAATGKNWQVGWIAFLNPVCDSAATKPTNGVSTDYVAESLLFSRTTGSSNYKLDVHKADVIRRLMFNPLGRLNDFGRFDLLYTGSDAARVNANHAYSICVSKLGRARRWKYAAESCTSD